MTNIQQLTIANTNTNILKLIRKRCSNICIVSLLYWCIDTTMRETIDRMTYPFMTNILSQWDTIEKTKRATRTNKLKELTINILLRESIPITPFVFSGSLLQTKYIIFPWIRQVINFIFKKIFLYYCIYNFSWSHCPNCIYYLRTPDSHCTTRYIV